MRSLNLRTRILTAVGLIAALNVVIGFVVVDATRDQLINQIDDRLDIAATPERGLGFDRDIGVPSPDRPPPPERLGDTYEGILQADGTLVTFFSPNSTGTELAPPAVDLTDAAAAASAASTITVDAAGGSGSYRAKISPVGDDFFITAIPLGGVDDTVARLVTVVVITVGVITVALALVAWWVLRLGIAPVKRMTTTAQAIAEGDLSQRITDTDERTEAGQLGQALNSMLGQIETSFEQRVRAEEKLRQFVADASHELRTPVATIRGYAELYRAGGLNEPDALDDAMRRTEQESQRMSRLIADMLNLAKLDRGPTVTTGPVDLAALARDAAAGAQVTHPDRTVDTAIDARPLIVDGDEDLLRQVLANVVGNAVLHTDADATIAVRAQRDGDNIVVAVTDDGDGMEPEVVNRVTERFYRADPSRSRNQGGSGLGLAIAEAAITAHHGSLRIDSTPGVGTTVSINLPAADPPR